MEHLIGRSIVEQVAEAQSSNLRTGPELAIKTVTTHLFAIGNYAYLCTLQRRPTGNSLHVLRIAVFAFVPTLIAVEFVNTQVRALKCFIQNQTEEDEEEKGAWFYISAGLGLPGPGLGLARCLQRSLLSHKRSAPLLCGHDA
jgi:hypothetical protein